MCRERAPVLQLLHAHRQRDEVALHALCGAGRQAVQQTFAFAFESRGAREIAGVDLRLEFADRVVQTLQQLLVQRVTRGVVFAEARAQLIGVAQPLRTRQVGGPVDPFERASQAFAQPAARGVVRTTSVSNSSGDSATGPAARGFRLRQLFACARSRSAASYNSEKLCVIP